MNEIKINNTMFKDIKHVDEMGNEYWLARELMPLLDYSKWENFYKVIQKAINACKNSNNNINEHFPGIRKTLEMPNNVVKRYITLCLLLDCSKRDLTKKGNYYLNQTAKNAGVKNFGRINTNTY